MALPLAPIAGVALRYGIVAIATYAATRRIGKGHFDQRGEEAMDDVAEGINIRRDKEQINATGRYKRRIRFGVDGPGFDVDITALGRVRFRRIESDMGI